MKQRFTIAALSLDCLASCRGGTAEGRRVVVERAGVAMGSELQLRAWTTDEAAARAAFEAVFAEFERLEALMSTWRPGSDVLRINAAAGVQPVPVDADVRDVLREARQISEWTERQVRRHLRRADRRLEVRPRSGQLASRPRTRSARGCRSSTTGGSRSTIAPAPCF